MQINAIKCKQCKDVIYSRANHDFVICACGNCYIDGGQQNNYYRVGGNSELIEDASFELDVTLKELYDDWNTGADKYGRTK